MLTQLFDLIVKKATRGRWSGYQFYIVPFHLLQYPAWTDYLIIVQGITGYCTLYDRVMITINR